MRIRTISKGMSVVQVATALRLFPDSHPAAWRKRTDELRAQGRNSEAKIVEREFSNYMSPEAERANQRTMSAIMAWAREAE